MATMEPPKKPPRCASCQCVLGEEETIVCWNCEHNKGHCAACERFYAATHL